MLHSVKCLLVDDLEENLLALSALLRRDDIELFQARSGAHALELLLTHDFALAFLDVQMPDMDGFELAELMRGSERTRHVPIIFVTAGTRDQHRVFKGYDLGAVDFLYKPIEPHILRNKAETFFQLHRQKLQLAFELKKSTETLRLNEMFTAVLGHDLRNPLNAILTSTQLLQRLSQDVRVQDTTQRMLLSGKRMSRMIEDMLDLARARLAGGIPLRCEPVDLLTLVQRVVRECQSATPTCHIDLIHDGNLRGEWDSDRLAQVSSNLLGNSIQHGASHQPIRVELDGRQSTHVVLTVTNTGTIPPAVLPHIFDPFRGGQSEVGKNEGLGLGLYIVQQIVMAHKGQVDVRSSDNNETSFRVTVPRVTGK